MCVQSPMDKQTKLYTYFRFSFCTMRTTNANLPLLVHVVYVINLNLFRLQNTDFANPVYQLTNQQRKDMKLRYYTTDVHKAAFALPAFLVDALEDAWHGSYLQRTRLFVHATFVRGPIENPTCRILTQIKRPFHLLNTQF